MATVPPNDERAPGVHRPEMMMTTPPERGGGLDSNRYTLSCACGADFGGGVGRAAYRTANERQRAHLIEHNVSVPTESPPGGPVRLDDYLTTEEQTRLARLLVNLQISAARQRAKREGER